MLPVQTAEGVQREPPGVRIPLRTEGQVTDESVLREQLGNLRGRTPGTVQPGAASTHSGQNVE